MKQTQEDLWARFLIANGLPARFYQKACLLLRNRGLFLPTLKLRKAHRYGESLDRAIWEEPPQTLQSRQEYMALTWERAELAEQPSGKETDSRPQTEHIEDIFPSQ